MGFRQDYRNETKAIIEETHAKFTKGSIMKHVIVMSLTASIGLIALFFVDLIDFYFISLLGKKELAAAIGYAGTILFFTSSINIGLSIAMGALVSKNIGAKKINEAKKIGIIIASFVFIASFITALFIFIFAPYFLGLIGAEGTTLELAIMYLRIIILGMPLLSLGMGFNSILKAKGEARNSMFVLLVGSIVNAILDPILIFGFNLGLEGAAISTLISRVFILLTAIFFIYRNKFFKGVSYPFNDVKKYLKPIIIIAIPAILTNLATPIGNAYVVSSISKFGDNAVAGMSMIGRISPVAFAVVFALSGAIGPIIGQNLGAKKLKRVKEVVYDSIKFSVIYIFSVSFVLFFTQNFIIDIFNLNLESKELATLFFTFLSWLFIFQALVFIANATFNNIGFAKNSTIINFLKATVFTMPFVYIGSVLYGANGVLLGQSIGFIIIGIIAISWCLWEVNKLEDKY